MSLTLLEAFRLLGPNEGDAEDLRRGDAAGVVLHELQRIVRRTSFPVEMHEDAVSHALVNLLTGGNRTEAARACDTDARVAGFLHHALRNALIDETRRKRRLHQFDDDVDQPMLRDDRHSPEGELIGRQTVEIRRAFFAEVVPACAAAVYTRASARRDFTEAVSQMYALATGALTLTGLQAAIAAESGRPVAENALHQRHSRARRELAAYVEGLSRRGDVDAVLVAEYRECVRFLQRRASSAKEAARAAQREHP